MTFDIFLFILFKICYADGKDDFHMKDLEPSHVLEVPVAPDTSDMTLEEEQTSLDARVIYGVITKTTTTTPAITYTATLCTSAVVCYTPSVAAGGLTLSSCTTPGLTCTTLRS